MIGQALVPGALVADKFRIVRQLGRGGMGAVYEIVHELTHHRRALKLLHPEWAERAEAVERFLREASAAGRIGNAHIVETFDAGRLPSGEPYLVMELLVGRNLADELADTGVLPLPELVDVMRQACEGVQAAHDAGIVHRDLKPENLFLIEREGARFVKVLDFGISKFVANTPVDRLTLGGTMGTPLYMSPEQLRGERNVDARSDVYALGVILYECAVGMHPYPSEELPTLIAKVLEGKTRAPIRELRPDLPVDLTEVIERAMARDRKERVQSARALALELAALQLMAKQKSASPDSFAKTLVAPKRGSDERDNMTPLEASARTAVGSTLASASNRVSESAPMARRPADLSSPRSVADATSVPPPPVTSEEDLPRPPAETLASPGPRSGRPLVFLGLGVGSALLAGGVVLARTLGGGGDQVHSEPARAEPTTTATTLTNVPEVAPGPSASAEPAPVASATTSPMSSSAPAANSARTPAASASVKAGAAKPDLATKGEFKP